MARQMASTDGLDIVGLRLSVVYGAGRRRGYMTYPSALMRDAATRDSITVRFGDQRLHWQYVEEVAGMIAVALSADRRGTGEVYNAFGDCRSWRDAAAILKSLKPGLVVEVREERDDALADVVEDYRAERFSRDYGVERQWPLEAGIAATLKAYGEMAA
jgi:nucleoside-diphosphate-sugar epimerase